jgi:hypothetical protein
VNSVQVTERILRDAFEDVALLLGATATTHRLRDGLLWALFRRLERVRERTFRRLEREARTRGPSPTRAHTTHPAVEQFLQRNRSRGGTASMGQMRGTTQKEVTSCHS